MDARSLLWNIKAIGTEKAQKAIDAVARTTEKLKTKMGQAEVAAEKWGTKLNVMSEKTSLVAKKMNKYSLPLLAVGVAGTKMAMDLENGINKISTLANKDILPKAKIKKDIREISDVAGIAQKELSESVYAALSAGVDSANVMEFIKSGVDLTRAGFTDMETVIDSTTTVMNAYGDKAYEVSKIHDIMVQTQDKGKISVDELGKNLGRIIPTASALGVEFDQLGVGYSILTARGQNANLATTNFNRLLSETAKTGGKADKILRQKTNKSFRQLIEEGKNIGEVLEILDDGARKAGLSLGDIFGDNAKAAAESLLGAGLEEYNSQLAEMSTIAGKTSENAQNLEGDNLKLAKSWNKLKNVMADAGEVIGAPVVGKVADVVGVAIDKFNGLDDSTKKVIFTVGGVIALAGPVIGAVSGILGIGGTMLAGIGKTIGVIVKLIPVIKGAVALLGGPWTLAIYGVIVAAIALWKNWDIVKEKVSNAIDTIKSKWESLRKAFKTPLKANVSMPKYTSEDTRNIGVIKSPKVDGSHATGLGYVPKDNYIGNLHEGEMVLPKSTSDAYRSAGGNIHKLPNQESGTSSQAPNIPINITINGNVDEGVFGKLEETIKNVVNYEFKKIYLQRG